MGGAQDNGSWNYLSGSEWGDVNGGDGGFTAFDYSGNFLGIFYIF